MSGICIQRSASVGGVPGSLTPQSVLMTDGAGDLMPIPAGSEADVLTLVDGLPAWATSGGGGGSAAWGDLTGTLSDQSDLQSALDAKLASYGIGDAVTSGTAGSVLFVDSAGKLAQSPTGLAWDDTHTQLALGKTADTPDLWPPGAGLRIFEPTARASVSLVTANGHNNVVTFATQRGTFAEPLPSLANDEIAELDFLAYQGYGIPGLTPSAILEVDVDAIAVDTRSEEHTSEL